MMLAIAPATVGVALLVFLAVLGTTRYVSLSSMTAGVVFAFLQLLPPSGPPTRCKCGSASCWPRCSSTPPGQH
ncbi:MAG: glycerol-3-phosphate acyltransferase [Hymenobacter sp.]